MRNEDYGRIARILADGTPGRSAVHNRQHHLPRRSDAHNTVSEIAGSDNTTLPRSPSAICSRRARATTALATWTVLTNDTHKFESRYLDRLIGPYPERARPVFGVLALNFTEHLSCPIIFLPGVGRQGRPARSRPSLCSRPLSRKNLPVAYVPFEGEQHGFRKAENIKRALDGELYFYSRVFGFPLADDVEPVEIENL